uniref:Lithostathine-1 n=1 Tax=Nannospalax galili TaxID=1026970 RepID=A0A8C6QD03_NANGA
MAKTRAYFILVSCLMFLSPSKGQEVEEDFPSARIMCPEGANAYSSYCYYFIEDCMIWNVNSGHLVSVLSLAKGNFVASLIKESGTTDVNVWTGLCNPQMNHRWHWSSGSLVIYKSWATRAPNNAY